MSFFKLGPFECPHCNHAILVDKVKLNDDQSQTVYVAALDYTEAFQGDPPGFNAVGRQELIREIQLLRDYSRSRTYRIWKWVTGA